MGKNADFNRGSGPTAQKELLSTGTVARICEVTPDTVLKWIKSGKVPCFKTPGGHYKIPQTSLSTILGVSGATPGLDREDRSHLYCWEYYADAGRIEDACRACIVYRSKALRCFDMVNLPAEAGHTGLHCERAPCEACDYYKLVQGQRPKAVVVATDERLRDRLLRAETSLEFDLRVVDSEYNCCLLINEFRPDFVVIDTSLGAKRCYELMKHLHADPRLPLVRVVLNRDLKGLPRALKKKVFAFIKGSITAKTLSHIVADFQDQNRKVPEAVM
jgi:excisionase family DNA binding protein